MRTTKSASSLSNGGPHIDVFDRLLDQPGDPTASSTARHAIRAAQKLELQARMRMLERKVVLNIDKSRTPLDRASQDNQPKQEARDTDRSPSRPLRRKLPHPELRHATALRVQQENGTPSVAKDAAPTNIHKALPPVPNPSLQAKHVGLSPRPNGVASKDVSSTQSNGQVFSPVTLGDTPFSATAPPMPLRSAMRQRTKTVPTYAHSHTDYPQPMPVAVPKKRVGWDDNIRPPASRLVTYDGSSARISMHSVPEPPMPQLSPRSAPRPAVIQRAESDHFVSYGHARESGYSSSTSDAHVDATSNRMRLNSIEGVLASDASANSPSPKSSSSYTRGERAAPGISRRPSEDSVSEQSLVTALSHPESLSPNVTLRDVSDGRSNFSWPRHYRRVGSLASLRSKATASASSDRSLPRLDTAASGPSREEQQHDSAVALRAQFSLPNLKRNGSISERIDYSSYSYGISTVTVGNGGHRPPRNSLSSLERTTSRVPSDGSIQYPLRVVNGRTSHGVNCTCNSQACYLRRMKRRFETCSIDDRMKALREKRESYVTLQPDLSDEEWKRLLDLISTHEELQDRANALKKSMPGTETVDATNSTEEEHFLHLMDAIVKMENDWQSFDSGLERNAKQENAKVGTAKWTRLLPVHWSDRLRWRRRVGSEPSIPEETEPESEVEKRKFVPRLRRVRKSISHNF